MTLSSSAQLQEAINTALCNAASSAQKNGNGSFPCAHSVAVAILCVPRSALR